ncbi:MAG TPA: enoyl-CoA hydratase/isomerase family protein [Egibacteraceae bacterium]|nr:enoyl-CoA hydratase/isomerase family protein [Egibacteraceae bacterium]
MALVAVEDRHAVRVLTLERPEARNAMSTALLGALLDAVADAVAAEHVRVLVVGGAGGHFSAGVDLREELGHAGHVRRMDLFCQVCEAVGTCPKPTLAAVEGHCVGGGAEVAAACDVRVADPSASFRFPGAALGVPVGAAKLVGLVGLGAAKELVLTARTVDAGEALRLGFLQRLAPAGGALDVALEVAGAIAGNDPDAVTHLKRLFARFSGTGDRIAVENDALHALAEAGGDYTALTMPDPKRTAGWSALDPGR